MKRLGWVCAMALACKPIEHFEESLLKKVLLLETEDALRL